MTERVHYGVHMDLEAAADELLRDALADLPRGMKMDVLTPWKLRDRLGREVYTSEGVPDPAVRKGIFGRAWNAASAHLNSRDGTTSRRARTEENPAAYFPDQAYQDKAGKVYSGRVRSQKLCRILQWGRTTRLQCAPCCRYLAAGPETRCSKCQTIYVSEEAFICV